MIKGKLVDGFPFSFGGPSNVSKMCPRNFWTHVEQDYGLARSRALTALKKLQLLVLAPSSKRIAPLSRPASSLGRGHIVDTFTSNASKQRRFFFDAGVQILGRERLSLTDECFSSRRLLTWQAIRSFHLHQHTMQHRSVDATGALGILPETKGGRGERERVGWRYSLMILTSHKKD
jgi:hypothetical protein